MHADRPHLSRLRERHRLLRRRGSIEQRTGLIARDEPAVRVAAVGEPFGERLHAAGACLREELRTGPRKHRHAVGTCRLDDRARHLPIFDRAGVQRPVWLHVRDLSAFIGRDLGERRELLGHVVAQHVDRDVEITATESLAVAVRRMRSDRNVAFSSRRTHHPHRLHRAGVKRTRHVRARHDVEQPLVVGEPLPDVGVEIDDH